MDACGCLLPQLVAEKEPETEDEEDFPLVLPPHGSFFFTSRRP
jgi:hypothetical protein